MPELNERVSILEVKFENMEEALKRLDVSLADNTGLTLQIKERIDKQNGLIPHMAESVKAMSEIQHQMMAKMNDEAVSEASTKVKVKILWAIVAALGTGLLGYVLKGFLG